jgi:exopolysaccharide biosynthesis polyprenyl glycosylphosphotransferase
MLWRSSLNRRISQLADALTTLSSIGAAYYLWLLLKKRFPALPIGSEFTLTTVHLIIVGLVVVVWLIAFKAQKAYSYQRFTSFATEVKLLLKTVLIGVLVLLGAMFLLRVHYVPRTLVFLFAALNLAFLILEKLFLFHAVKIIRQRGRNRKKVLVVGTGARTKRFVDTIAKHFSWGLDVLGFLDADKENIGKVVFGEEILGTYGDIESMLHSRSFDEVIISVEANEFDKIEDALNVCEREGVQVRIISDFLGGIARHFRADVVYGLPVISIVAGPENEQALLIKRLLDIIGASIGLILAAPLLLIVTVAVKFSSPGPVLYKTKWIGKDRKLITGYKFRTMVNNAEELKRGLLEKNEMSGPVFKMASDPRVTPLGRILRKFSLDELPQLWCVLKGDLSFVGPRPPLSTEVEKYESWHRRRLSIKPGLTCLWQVSGRNSITDFDEWARLDLEYIDNWSLWLDLKIFLKTIPVVFLGRNAH